MKTFFTIITFLVELSYYEYDCIQTYYDFEYNCKEIIMYMYVFTISVTQLTISVIQLDYAYEFVDHIFDTILSYYGRIYKLFFNFYNNKMESLYNQIGSY